MNYSPACKSLSQAGTWALVTFGILASSAPVSAQPDTSQAVPVRTSLDTAWAVFLPGANAAEMFQQEMSVYMAEEEGARVADVPTLTCSTIPTASQVSTGNFDFVNTIMSTSQAVKTGILSAATGSYDGNSKVLVVNYSRSANCPTQDANVSFLYGQTIRAIIQLQNYEGSANFSFSALAASGTLSGRSQMITVQTRGISNPKLTGWLAAVNGKDFNVENYAAFIDFLNKITTLPDDSQTTTSVVYLGRLDTTRFAEGVTLSFALYRLARGNSCAEAKAALPTNLRQLDGVVGEVYMSVMSTCDTTRPSQIQRLQAESYLAGLKVTT